MKFRVVVFPQAERDLLEIRSYWEDILQTSADTLIDAFVEALHPLTQTPEMYTFMKDHTLSARGFRSVAVENYLIAYKIAGTTVQVHRFLYGRRRFSDLV